MGLGDVADFVLGNISDNNLTKIYNQNYDKIKKKCNSKGELWVDPYFGPNDKSLWEGKNKRDDVVWKRTKDISPEAKLFVGGTCEDDVEQGVIGNCWFVAAVACFALHDRLVEQVIPDVEKQELDNKDYAGIVVFKFYRFGEWVEVCVDDQLPTAAKSGKLLFMHSNDKSEFWCALLEKAYAKLAGSYEALNSGTSADALCDLTGGVSQYYDFVKSGISADEAKQDELFKDLLKALSRCALVNCSMVVNEGEGQESKRDNGLIVGHAYTVVKCYELSLGLFGTSGKYKMIKLRNPWGDTEWQGTWNDNDPKWKELSDSDKKDMDFTNEDDGEFWMEFHEMLEHFDNITICRIINTDMSMTRKRWHMQEVRGAWVPGENAGGCANFPDTYWSNPQIQFQILEEEDETVQLVLSQKDLRIEDRENLTIGFRIFKVADDNTLRLTSKKGTKTAGKTKFTDTRELYHRCELEIGRYVLIPSTFDQHVAGDFLVRIFTEDDAFVEELKD